MEYRLATPADSPSIAHLITTTWGEPADHEWIAYVIQLPVHAVWIAIDGTTFAGFCAGFTTNDLQGLLRWEVDLLAVSPAARGKGIGKQLVANSSQTGFARGAKSQRGLVAFNNTRAEHCFAAAGFSAAQTYELWVGEQASAEKQISAPPNTHLIAVETLTYNGVWVENNVTGAALLAAQQKALKEGRTTVGAVIPTNTPHSAETLSFAHINTYQWWNLRL